MINLTDQILRSGDTFDRCFRDGVLIAERLGRHGGRTETLRQARSTWASIRSMYGLKGAPTLLTEPDGNLKLSKADRVSYGLTLQHYVVKLRKSTLTVNACPFAGDCTRVCVLDNGSGRYTAVQLARRARTQLFAEAPCSAGVLLGYDLARAVEKVGPILFRPNVNSDVQWELVCPSLTSGGVFGDDVMSYGYSKLPSTLSHQHGYVDHQYRVAYSWNEKSPDIHDDVITFLQGGGNVSIVTDRKPKQPIEQWDDDWGFEVVDADLTDEWILDGYGVWGDLSAKGKARKLIGNSGFVVSVYDQG